MKTRAWDGERFRDDYVVMPDGSVVVLSLDRTYGDKLKYTVPWTLSRFTGLLDKNGKEIYEGDIVRHPEYYFYDHLMPGGIEVIEWDGNGFNELLWFGYGNYPDHVEVIGNVFQNPELLEVK